MQEFEQEIAREGEQGVVVVLRGAARLTPKLLKLALKLAINAMKLAAKTAALPITIPIAVKDKAQANLNAEHHGKQTVKQLARQNKGLQSIDVNQDAIKDFNRIAKKYGVDFAPRRLKGERSYMVFFKAQDTDALTAVFKEYTAREARKSSRPSLRQKLEKLKPKTAAHERSSRPVPVR